MIRTIQSWFNRYFSDPEAVLLCVLLVLGFGLVMSMGEIMAPVLASIVIAYLLEWIVSQLQSLCMPRLPALFVAFIGFWGLVIISLMFLLPLLWTQISNLFNDLPNMTLKGQGLLIDLAERFPDFFTEDQINTVSNGLLAEARDWTKVVLSISWSSITWLITGVVYLVLVPLLVFFFLKDKEKIIGWAVSFLPSKRSVLKQVSVELNQQIANYIRGKVVEIIVVGIASYLVFWFFDVRYAALLASLVGISVLIPYVGATIVTIPVILVGYLQWGMGAHFGYFMLAYLIVQGLDANVLVPLLFSEAVNLHPIAIIVAILFFGGIWGFWGIFFAIPLATLVKAVLNAWPSVAQGQTKPRLPRKGK